MTSERRRSGRGLGGGGGGGGGERGGASRRGAAGERTAAGCDIRAEAAAVRARPGHQTGP